MVIEVKDRAAEKVQRVKHLPRCVLSPTEVEREHTLKLPRPLVHALTCTHSNKQQVLKQNKFVFTPH